MKFVFPLCMLVILLVCHEALGIVTVEEGECTSSDFNESQLKGCGNITNCKKHTNGTVSEYRSTICFLLSCEDGREPQPGDDTKVFPDCCSRCA